MLRKFALTTALLAAGLTAAYISPPLAAAFGVGVQPSTVEMTVKPGDRQRQVVTIGNVHKSKTISLTMGLADWSLDKDGKLILDAPGETSRSAAEWIRFSPASVDPSMLTMEIKNEGDAHARLQGSAFVKKTDGTVVAETPLSAVVLDGGERTYNVKLEDHDKLVRGESYVIDFKLNNSFAPQNKFRAMNVDIESLDYKLP